MTDLQTVPNDWLADIEDAIKNPEQFKYTGWGAGDNRIKTVRKSNSVIPAELLRHYDRFHSRAIVHSKTKGEHEAMGLLNFYVVWKYHLWRAEYKSWNEYVRDISNMPFAISATTIKTSVSNIDTFVKRGMEFQNIIKVMGLAKTASKMLVDVPDELLPGGNLNSAASMIIELGPGEAIAAVNDWTGRATYYAVGAIHDNKLERLYIEVKRTKIDGSWDRLDWQVNMIDADAAGWFMDQCHVRHEARVFK